MAPTVDALSSLSEFTNNREEIKIQFEDQTAASNKEVSCFQLNPGSKCSLLRNLELAEHKHSPVMILIDLNNKGSNVILYN